MLLVAFWAGREGFPSPCGELRVSDEDEQGRLDQVEPKEVSVPLRGIEGV